MAGHFTSFDGHSAWVQCMAVSWLAVIIIIIITSRRDRDLLVAYLPAYPLWTSHFPSKKMDGWMGWMEWIRRTSYLI